MAKRQTADAPEIPPAPDRQGSGQIYDHLELLSAMGQDFASSLDIEASLRRAIEHIADYVDAEGGALFLLDDKAEMLRCHACAGPTEITGLTLGADQGIVGRCVQNDASEIIRDVPKASGFHGDVD